MLTHIKILHLLYITPHIVISQIYSEYHQNTVNKKLILELKAIYNSMNTLRDMITQQMEESLQAVPGS